MVRIDEFGSAAVDPFSVSGIRRATETIRWGHDRKDRARIAGYYAMRLLAGLLRSDHDVTSGMHPQFWIGDVCIDSPIGSFACRARTIDLDIVNPNYEYIEVETFRQQLERLRGKSSVCVDMGAHIGKFSILAGRRVGRSGRVFAFEPEPRNFRQLQVNIALNGLDNVHPVNAAGGGAKMGLACCP